MQSCLESIVPVCITRDFLFHRKNWNANLSLTICIWIILPGEPVRCLLNLNCENIRLDAVKQADICVKYIDFIRNNGIRQSMDGKSRWADNIMIERWFRSFKYEEAYLTEYANLKEAREAIGRYIYTYNFERCHQSIGNKRPAEVYYPVMLLDAARAAA